MSNRDLSVNQRIKDLIEDLQLTQRAFAMSIGVSQSAVSALFSQRENRPGLDMLQKIAIAYPQIRLEWLLIGQGMMLKPNVQPSELRSLEMMAKNLLEKGFIPELYIDIENEPTEARLAAMLDSEAELRRQILYNKYLENNKKASYLDFVDTEIQKVLADKIASLEAQYILTVYSRMHVERTLLRQELSTTVYRVAGEPDPAKSYGGLLSIRLDISNEAALQLVEEGNIRSAFIDGEGYRVTEQAVREFFGEV